LAGQRRVVSETGLSVGHVSRAGVAVGCAGAQRPCWSTINTKRGIVVKTTVVRRRAPRCRFARCVDVIGHRTSCCARKHKVQI
jgi:hypothetical protein